MIIVAVKSTEDHCVQVIECLITAEDDRTPN
jgi:hypothetical protein